MAFLLFRARKVQLFLRNSLLILPTFFFFWRYFLQIMPTFIFVLLFNNNINKFNSLFLIFLELINIEIIQQLIIIHHFRILRLFEYFRHNILSVLRWKFSIVVIQSLLEVFKFAITLLLACFFYALVDAVFYSWLEFAKNLVEKLKNISCKKLTEDIFSWILSSSWMSSSSYLPIRFLKTVFITLMLVLLFSSKRILSSEFSSTKYLATNIAWSCYKLKGSLE